MKKLITIGYVAALIMSGVGFAKASEFGSQPTSVMMCKVGIEMFKQGIAPDEMIEILNESKKAHVEDKLIIVNCYFEERAKV